MKTFGIIGLLSLTALWLRAEEPTAKPTDAQTKLEALQLKLEHTARRVNQPTSSGSNVVGLRGSKQSDAKTLYWKKKDREMPVTPEEVKIFRAAVEQARGGQTVEALVALKTFVKTYPQSALLADVNDTITLIEHP